MGDPVSSFKARSSTDILPNPDLSGNVPIKDTPDGDKKKLSRWVKWVIGCNIIMVHLVVMFAGFKDIPFTLSDTALAAYIVIGLGMPVGLANQTIRSALGALFGMKS